MKMFCSTLEQYEMCICVTESWEEVGDMGRERGKWKRG